MIPLNVTASNQAQEIIKIYLEENASETLAEKINNGVIIEKNGKRLISKKDLNGFMSYACDEARKLSEKGKNSACVPDNVVYGWAIHYFEENSIEGTLYNEDGSEYIQATHIKAAAALPLPKQPKQQISFFDIISEDKKTDLYLQDSGAKEPPIKEEAKNKR